MRRRSLTWLTAGAFVFAACGSPAEPSAQPAGERSSTTATGSAGDDPEQSVSGTSPTTPAPATAATLPATTEAGTQAPAILWPDDGCSADNAPTPTDVRDGPLPALEVRAESVDNALPDLAVRRINCNGGWVNLKNELPADRPLLVWFWAPH